MVQWLQQMTQPDLEQRFRSVAEARAWPTAREMDVSKAALVPAPANSRIKLQRRGDRHLLIQMPLGRLRLRKIQRPIAFFQAIGVILVSTMAFALVMFLFLGQIFVINNGLGWLLVIALLWMVFLALIALSWRRILPEFRSGQFDLTDGTISLSWPGVPERQFQARQAWQLSVRKRRYLSLYLGRWELQFNGSTKELSWLDSHLKAALSLESDVSRES